MFNPQTSSQLGQTFHQNYQHHQHLFNSEGNYFQTAAVAQSTNPFLDDQTSEELTPQRSTGFFSEFACPAQPSSSTDLKGEDNDETTVKDTADPALKVTKEPPAQNQRHRRNVSDISLSSFADAHRYTSAFHAGRSSGKGSRKNRIKNSDDDDSNGIAEGGGDPLPDVEDEGHERDHKSVPKRPLSADITDWNPFNEDNFEDSIFGREFDRVNRGSNSSISGVKSREDLVMSNPDVSSTNDPFSAAPLGPLGRMKKLAVKKTRAKLDLKETGSSSSVEGDGYSKLRDKESTNQETKAETKSKIPLVGSYINSSASGQVEGKQSLLSQMIEGQSETTAGRTTSVSHDILIGTARLVKRAVGGASDMYKQFVEPSTDDMGIGIFGKTREDDEDDDEDGTGKSNKEGMDDASRGDADVDRKRRLEEVKDILNRSSAIENMKKEELTSNGGTLNLKEKLLADQSPASVAKTTNGKTGPLGLTTEASKSFFKAGLFSQFATKDGAAQSAATQPTVTFQKLQNDDESTMEKSDSQELPSSDWKGADGPASVDPGTAKSDGVTTADDLKLRSSKPTASLLKNPFTAAGAKVGEVRKLSVPNILSFVSSSGGGSSGSANQTSGSAMNENTSLLSGEGSNISIAAASSSSFKLPFQAGFDVFGAAPFRKKKLPQPQSKKPSERAQHKTLVNQPSDGSLKSPISPDMASPEAYKEETHEDNTDDANYFHATFDTTASSSVVTTATSVTSSTTQPIKKSASPFSTALPLFSLDSLRSKTSKKEFSLLKNEHSIESFASVESFSQNPPSELTPVSQKDVSATFPQINQLPENPSNVSKTVTPQEKFADFEGNSSMFARDDQQCSWQLPAQHQIPQTISFQAQPFLHQAKTVQQIPGQLNQSWVSFEQNQMAAGIPKTPKGKNPFLEDHQASFLPMTVTFDSKNDDDNDAANDDDNDDEQGKLFRKKEESRDSKQRSKSLFDQSQVPKFGHAENKKKIGPGLSFAEDQSESLTTKERYVSSQHHWFHHVPNQSKSKSKMTPSSEFANLGFTDDPDAIIYGSAEVYPVEDEKKVKGKPDAGIKKKRTTKPKAERPTEGLPRDGASPDYSTPSKIEATPTHHHTLPRAGSKKHKSTNQNFTLLTQSANAQSDNSVDSSNMGVFPKITYV